MLAMLILPFLRHMYIEIILILSKAFIYTIIGKFQIRILLTEWMVQLIKKILIELLNYNDVFFILENDINQYSIALENIKASLQKPVWQK